MKAKVQLGKVTFDSFTPKQEQVFWKRMESLEAKVKGMYVATGVDDAAEIFDSSLNMGEIIRSLPSTQKDAIMKEYNDLIGFDMYTKKGSSAITRYETSATKGIHKMGVDMQKDQLGKYNPLSIIYNRMTMNEDYRTKELKPGTNILKSSHLRGLADQIKILPGKSVLVFDTETASLGIGNVREIAAFRVETELVNNKLTVTSPTKKTFHRNLKTTSMRLGAIYDKERGAVQTMEEVLSKSVGFNFVEGEAGQGDVFKKVMDDFMKEITDSQYIVGQNIQFDIGQLFQGIKKTSAYKNDQSFKQKVLKAENHMQGKIVDTLELARTKLPDLRIADEVRFNNAVSTHSLENLLLKTNLADEIMKDMGEDAFLTKIGARGGAGGAVHAADVDTLIETYLFKFLTEDRLEAADSVDRRVRTAVAKSWAPTPVTNIANLGHLAPEVSERLYDMGKIEVMDKEGKRIDARKMFPGGHNDMANVLDGDNAPAAKFNITPVEQMAFVQRDMGLKVGNITEKNMPVLGNSFAAFSGADIKNRGFLNASGSLYKKGTLPTMDEYAAFQKQAAKSGDLLAGLSLPERMITEGMHRATVTDVVVSDALSPVVKEANSLMGDLGISHFQLMNEVDVGGSGAITMPSSLLDELADVNMSGAKDQPLEMARVSTFRERTGKHRANISVDISDESRQSLIKRFTDMTDDEFQLLSNSRTKKESVILALGELQEIGSGRYAIAFGQVSGKAAETVAEVLEPFMNSGQIVSDATEMAFHTPILETSDGIARTGAFVSDKLMEAGEGERVLFDDLAKQTLERQGIVREMAETGDLIAPTIANDARVSLGRAGVGSGQNLSKVAAAAAEVVHKATKRLPLIGGVLAGAITAKAGYNAYQERGQLNETFAFQGHGEQGDYYRLQQELEQQRDTSRYVDPFSTAGVVGNLSNFSQRSGFMGSNKNDHLFAGVM
jgi:DNA polymerase III epsilon subunit-like protein